MLERFHVRLATRDDARVIARHRAEMFRHMGQLPGDLYDDLVAASVEYLEDALATGEYVGWLASTHQEPVRIVAGAGVQRRRTLPHPLADGSTTRIAYGRQAVVVNVFTEDGWQRQGLATVLMSCVIDWARHAGIDTLVLHASDQGRALYERLGFSQTNEMRYRRPLTP